MTEQAKIINLIPETTKTVKNLTENSIFDNYKKSDIVKEMNRVEEISKEFKIAYHEKHGVYEYGERVCSDMIEYKKLQPTVGFLYVVSDGDYYKIGYTKSSLNGRISVLQTGNPKKLKLIFEKKKYNICEVEKECHAFAEKIGKRMMGEWFSFNEKIDVDHLIRFCDECIENWSII